MLKPEEVTQIIEKKFKNTKPGCLESVGYVIQVGDGSPVFTALMKPWLENWCCFITESQVWCSTLTPPCQSIFGADREIKEGDQVKRTGKIVQVPVGKA